MRALRRRFLVKPSKCESFLIELSCEKSICKAQLLTLLTKRKFVMAMFYVNCIILITLLYNILGSESWKSLDSTRRFRFWTWPSNLWCMCTSTLIFIAYLQLDLWMNRFLFKKSKGLLSLGERLLGFKHSDCPLYKPDDDSAYIR